MYLLLVGGWWVVDGGSWLVGGGWAVYFFSSTLRFRAVHIPELREVKPRSTRNHHLAIVMLKLSHYDETPMGDRLWFSDHNVITST